MKNIQVPISPAELLDKIAILEIKENKIGKPEKLVNVRRELEFLRTVAKENIEFSNELNSLFKELQEINLNGWNIEDGKRECEREKNFGSRFVELARGAFINNDRRSAVWKQINLLLKSEIIQEKSYEKY